VALTRHPDLNPLNYKRAEIQQRVYLDQKREWTENIEQLSANALQGAVVCFVLLLVGNIVEMKSHRTILYQRYREFVPVFKGAKIIRETGPVAVEVVGWFTLN